VLFLLLVEANPILAHWADDLPPVDLLPVDLLPGDLHLGAMLRRAMFWAGLGLILWPFLCVSAARSQPTAAPPRAQWGVFPGLNPASVANALIVFNLMLGVQTAMDIGYLWAAGTLPEGLTYAA
jgi:hypothetical protein